MPAERFYIDAPLTDTLSLEGTEFHHLAHVMRARVGDSIELVNGRGALATAEVTALSRHSATLSILSATTTPTPSERLLLAIPLMRPSKLELIIEKCTELGADTFWLYPAHHSDKDDLSPNQLERLTHIAISAMKQCGRLDLPPILLKRFDDLFQTDATCLFGDTRPTAHKIPHPPKALFITGPEKGFSPQELKLLDQKATGVQLHRNILRAETAPIVALCLLQQD
ncbi:MAG TPA: RsmE family RNA methyltransferase [Chlamydiales bacterium]|nr:RsmE family RNA methyltransferase [Chlamydiales bacterium]